MPEKIMNLLDGGDIADALDEYIHNDYFVDYVDVWTIILPDGSSVSLLDCKLSCVTEEPL